jgi:transcription antitermination factor NusG
MTPGAAWHALAVHSRSEATAAKELRARLPASDDVFFPVRVERRAWSDRVKRFEVPLFPGYLFVRTALSAEKRVELLHAKGVLDVVGRYARADHAGPSSSARRVIARSIPDIEIEALRVVVASERALDPIERLVRGKHVVVASGALRGARGVVEEGPDGQRRLVLQIALLGRGVRTVLHADDVVESSGDDVSRVA